MGTKEFVAVLELPHLKDVFQYFVWLLVHICRCREALYTQSVFRKWRGTERRANGPLHPHQGQPLPGRKPLTVGWVLFWAFLCVRLHDTVSGYIDSFYLF